MCERTLRLPHKRGWITYWRKATKAWLFWGYPVGRVLLVAAALLLGAVAGWQARSLNERPVRAVGTFLFLDKLADAQYPYLSATGTWRGGDLANKINTVRIVCDSAASTCEMEQADIVKLGDHSFLSLHSSSFKITQADANSVTAVDNGSALCVWVTLLFDRVAKAVSLVRTKINKEDVCSMVQDEPVTISLGEPL